MNVRPGYKPNYAVEVPKKKPIDLSKWLGYPAYAILGVAIIFEGYKIFVYLWNLYNSVPLK